MRHSNAPDEGARKVLVGTIVELDSSASPSGWHTSSDTRGNNVVAQENWDGGDAYVNNLRPDGGKNLSFSFPIHMTKPGKALDPKSYINASVTELFYTCNEIHDLFYRCSFIFCFFRFPILMTLSQMASTRSPVTSRRTTSVGEDLMATRCRPTREYRVSHHFCTKLLIRSRDEGKTVAELITRTSPRVPMGVWAG